MLEKSGNALDQFATMITIDHHQDFRKLSLPLGSSSAQASVVVVGNFDGVHLGHQALMSYARGLKDLLNPTLVALTFYPHPRVFFSAITPEDLFFSEEQKSRALSELGASVHVRQRFDQAFSQLSGEEFIHEVLLKSLGARYVVVGEDFCFARNRSWDSHKLKQALDRLGVGCHVHSPTKCIEGKILSSTLLRQYGRSGDMIRLRQSLGRPVMLEGTSEPGEGLGHRYLFPTANVALGRKYPLQSGVYQALVSYDSSAKMLWDPLPCWQKKTAGPKLHQALVNLGYSPTVKTAQPDQPPLLEVYLLDHPDADLVGKHFCVWLLEFLRKEQRFQDLTQLKEQISADIIQAQRFFDRHRGA